MHVYIIKYLYTYTYIHANIYKPTYVCIRIYI